jgi:hypothetical protein
MAKYQVVWAAAIAAALAFTGCGSDDQDLDTSAQVPVSDGEATRVHADYGRPGVSLADWATYGDAYVVFVVSDLQRVPPSGEDQGRTEGVLVAQDVTVRIENVLWRRSGAGTPPGTVTYDRLGWIVSDGKEGPVLVNNEPPIEIGRRYVGVLADFDGKWSTLGSDAVAALTEDGTIDVPDPDPKRNYSPKGALLQSDGKTPEEVAALLAQTPAQPSTTLAR